MRARARRPQALQLPDELLGLLGLPPLPPPLALVGGVRYKLRVRCEIQQTDDSGCYYGQGLNVEENIEIDAGSFMEIAAVLSRFHDLSEDIKAKKHSLSPLVAVIPICH